MTHEGQQELEQRMGSRGITPPPLLCSAMAQFSALEDGTKAIHTRYG